MWGRKKPDYSVPYSPGKEARFCSRRNWDHQWLLNKEASSCKVFQSSLSLLFGEKNSKDKNRTSCWRYYRALERRRWSSDYVAHGGDGENTEYILESWENLGGQYHKERTNLECWHSQVGELWYCSLIRKRWGRSGWREEKRKKIKCSSLALWKD